MQLTTNRLTLMDNVLKIALSDDECENMARVMTYLPKPIFIAFKCGKPSKSIRAYLWKLCNLLALKLSQSGVVYTKNDVYRAAIKECMEWTELDMPSKAVERFNKIWKKNGLGFSTEVCEDDGETATVFCYYGTSTYDTKDIVRLVNYIKQECVQQGIDVRTPKEIALEMQK